MLQELLHGMIAQTADAAAPQQQGGYSMFVPMILIFIVMYFLILRPQSQAAKKTQQLLTQLKKGDDVLLQNGFYGKIFEVRDSDFIVELAPNVKVRVLKSGVTGLAPKAGEPKAEADKKT